MSTAAPDPDPGPDPGPDPVPDPGPDPGPDPARAPVPAGSPAGAAAALDWRTWVLRRVPPLRRSLDQVPAHRAYWAAANAAVRAEREQLSVAGAPARPLWVVLGDSTAQAVGVADPADGYVRRVQALLAAAGRPHDVVNLAVSGALVRDVVDTQWPAARELLPAAPPRPAGAGSAAAAHPTPTLVSAVVGGNDLRHRPAAVADALRALVAVLPAGALIGLLPHGLRERVAVPANAALRAAAAERGLRVVDLWAATAPPYRGKYADGLHPNVRGVTDWVRAFAAALGVPGEGSRPAPPAP